MDDLFQRQWNLAPESFELGVLGLANFQHAEILRVFWCFCKRICLCGHVSYQWILCVRQRFAPCSSLSCLGSYILALHMVKIFYRIFYFLTTSLMTKDILHFPRAKYLLWFPMNILKIRLTNGDGYPMFRIYFWYLLASSSWAFYSMQQCALFCVVNDVDAAERGKLILSHPRPKSSDFGYLPMLFYSVFY